MNCGQCTAANIWITVELIVDTVQFAKVSRLTIYKILTISPKNGKSKFYSIEIWTQILYQNIVRNTLNFLKAISWISTFKEKFVSLMGEEYKNYYMYSNHKLVRK